MSEILKGFERALSGPPAASAAARADRRPIVGVIGEGIPLELILASGAAYATITPGTSRDTPKADHHLDDIYSLAEHNLVEAALDGGFDDYDLVVLSRRYQHVFYFLQELRRLGSLPKSPPFVLFDMVPSRREVNRPYNRSEMIILRTKLERTAGVTIDDVALRTAIATMDSVRAARATVERLRAARRLSGADAFVVHRAAAFVPPADYVDRVAAFADTLGGEAEAPGSGVLLLSAEPILNADLHRAVEDCGGQVIGEDDYAGARGAVGAAPADGDPIDALVDLYWWNWQPLASYPVADTRSWFGDQLKRDDVRGVVIHLPRSDQHFGWDVPDLCRMADAAGVPWLRIEREIDDLKAYEPTLRSWIADLSGRTNQGASL